MLRFSRCRRAASRRSDDNPLASSHVDKAFENALSFTMDKFLCHMAVNPASTGSMGSGAVPCRVRPRLDTYGILCYNRLYYNMP